MDVNLTISLMRGQMGVVIEKAVNAAVETVLGEMIRVMSLKFEQLRRELTTKEKENEDIRKMLESTRCQMKVLRQKYVNALNTKDDRHAPHRHTLGQINAARQAAGHLDANRQAAGHLDASRQAAGHLDANRQAAGHLDANRQAAGHLDASRQAAGHLDASRQAAGHLEASRPAAGHLDASRQAAGHLDASRQAAGQLDTTRAHQITPDHGLPLRRRSSNTGSPSAEPLTLSLKPRNPDPAHTALPVPKTHKVTHEPVPTESCQNAEMHNEEVPELKLHLGLKVENTCSLAQECSDPLWGQTPQKTTEAEHTEVTDPNLLPVAHTIEALNSAITDTSQPVLKIKQEEAEVEIVEVKEEQAEPSTSELPKIELHQHLAGAGVAIELQVPQQCVQIPSGTEPAFMGVDPSAYTESQLTVADTQRQLHPFCKDLMLYEDYKRKRIEVRKRSETRRRELERTLPQALLADLVKERREKTRLRVARWRAKRKLQACLMAQAAQFNSTQAFYTQRNGRGRGGAGPQQGGIGLGTAQSESGVYTMPLQMGTNPLLAAQRLGMAEGQMQPGASVFVQQRTSAAGTENYQ
ncbi:uncharacterized protein si:ch211-67e16.4 isoform X2 [Silurus meridionalis]|uniref:uncharacterized protein si:ch211-67e16.4 isoform X2 n=1 Tax=Silurus meridionalis TaxID=175797 RepID=UPI001EEB11B7|nr:uncharacterized protein si:ch211-67e16.4 isoform X2 [Silurus meridionalis]